MSLLRCLRFVNRCSSFSNPDSLVFLLNGERQTIENPRSAISTLSSYLRRNDCKSVKIGCEEGGCGACTIIGQHLDGSGKVQSMTLNSCLMPICATQGMSIWTLEGLRETDMMKTIMESFGENHATQCGFCTPGFEMAVFDILCNEDMTSLTDQELEYLLAGNICRCTGYRSILSAIEDAASKVSDLPSPLDSLFPEELRNSEFQESKFFQARDGTKWFHPTTIDDIFSSQQILEEISDVDFHLISGGTELILDTNFSHTPTNFINIRNVPSLSFIDESSEDHMLHIGSSTSLSSLLSHSKKKSQLINNPHSIFDALTSHLSLFASPHIRNVASIAGNIVTSSPTSDLAPLLVACDAEIHIASPNRNNRKVHAPKFFNGYRSVDLAPNEIITHISIPLIGARDRPGELIRLFKQSKRRLGDLATINACMRASICPEENTVEELVAVYGCVDTVPFVAEELGAWAKGKKIGGRPGTEGWPEKEIFQESVGVLKAEIAKPFERKVRKVPEYRQTMALSFWHQFFHEDLMVCEKGESREGRGAFQRDGIGSGEKWYEPELQGQGVGRPVQHMSTEGHVSGTSLFVDDFGAVESEEYLALVYTERAEGTIESVEWEEALAMEGVRGAVDWRDIREAGGENLFGVAVRDEKVLVEKDISMWGEMVGGVVADTPERARAAADRVKIGYGVKKGQSEGSRPITIDEAVETESFFDYRRFLERGDVEEVFGTAQESGVKVLEGELYCGGQEHFYIEPICVIVNPLGDSFHVNVTTQNVCDVQRDISEVIGVDQNRIVVKSERLGGAFGGKESRPAKYSCVAALAAQKYDVPIRLLLDRPNDMESGSQRHSFKCDYKVAFDSITGDVKALDVELINNGGFSTDMSPAVIERAVLLFDSFYNFPAFRILGRTVETNRQTGTAMRGFGVPQAAYFGENILFRVAEEVGVDVNELRGRYLYGEGEETPYGAVLENCKAKEIWEYVFKMSDIEKREEEIANFNEEHEWRKRALYVTPAKYGIGYARVALNTSNALVHVYRDGSVLVSHGGSEMGQGLYTKCLQVAATTLDVDLDRVHSIETATDKCANASPCTSASVGTDLNAMAVQLACEEIVETLEPYKEICGYPEECNWRELVNFAHMDRASLTGRGHYATPGIEEVDWTTGEPGVGAPYAYYTYSAACSEVEVDVMSGEVHVLRSDIAFDLGKSISPEIDIGQIEGAFVQGLGWIFTEEVVFGVESDHRWNKRGELISKGTGGYKIPTVNDIPLTMNVHLLPDSNNPYAVMGSKGLGEPPLCLSLSAYFATRKAIHEFRKEKGQENNNFTLDVPTTPERVRMACMDNLVREVLGNDVDDYIPKRTY